MQRWDVDEAIVDLRGLDPPEPMVRILDALDALDGEAAGRFSFLLSREPIPLYALLAAGGWRHDLHRDDHGFRLTVYR